METKNVGKNKQKKPENKYLKVDLVKDYIYLLYSYLYGKKIYRFKLV